MGWPTTIFVEPQNIAKRDDGYPLLHLDYIISIDAKLVGESVVYILSFLGDHDIIDHKLEWIIFFTDPLWKPNAITPRIDV